MLMKHLNSVSAKILLLVGAVCLTTVIVASIGILQMSRIGKELESIAEKDIPLARTVSTVTAHQLHQAVLLERMLRLAGISSAEGSASLSELETEVLRLSHEVEAELEKTLSLARDGATTALTPIERQKFGEVAGKIATIEADYLAFEAEVAKVIELLRNGDLDRARDDIGGIVKLEKGLDASLLDLQADVEAFTETAASNAVEHEHDGIRQMLVTSVLSVALGAALAFAYARFRIAGPLIAVTRAILGLTRGDLNAEIRISRGDEIGKLAGAYETFRQTMLEIERLREEQAALDERLKMEKRAATLQLASDLEADVKTVSDALASAIAELDATAASLAATATQTSDRSASVASAAEQSQASVQTVAAAAEELSSSIQEISRQVSEATRVTASTVEHARSSSETVELLSGAASRIDDVVGLINDIAGQTNLLALNATIEAARAGEAGKGFAVVAAEVKDLATQTAKATGDIRAQVEELQHGSELTRTVITQVVQAIAEMNGQISAIAAAVEEQNAVTSEISRNANEVSRGSTEISVSIRDVSEGATSSSAAATQLRSTIEGLNHQSQVLQSKLDGFLSGIRAA
ncbi:methyl-accepting chemotaxis protein [Roseibium aestuarii]|uniref:Methyl-accepting chemotaxis protein n=1 Tax=Roseibium aestuarii TaxID=2600299 RepID=A0ABW4JWD7_9HYPH|nr:methyl-accepting chemotaxis protein [Roseibium aestuarii]